MFFTFLSTTAFAFCFLLLLLLFASAFASAFAFCFCFCICFCFVLLPFAFPSAFAFASADYLLCIDTATKLGDKTFTLSFDTQLHQSRNDAAQRCLYLICIAGEALRPPPHPVPLFFIVPTTVHHPYYFQYLYRSDHPATSLTTVTTTTIFFALTLLPQRWISTLLSPKNPETSEAQRQPQRSPYYSSSLLFPHSYLLLLR